MIIMDSVLSIPCTYISELNTVSLLREEYDNIS